MKSVPYTVSLKIISVPVQGRNQELFVCLFVFLKEGGGGGGVTIKVRVLTMAKIPSWSFRHLSVVGTYA